MATTLASADPLVAKDCELPTAPQVPCATREPAVEPHDHEQVAPEPAPPAPAAVTPGPPTSTRPAQPTKVRDPVCGMLIDPRKAAGGSVTRNGVTTHFCSAVCKRTFLARVADGGTP
ncbi:MAG: hypothetical protein SFW67_08010 [Myxococcaceae bacterium]|nr:hypothetical protein [Myxococcaceae bacterium]